MKYGHWSVEMGKYGNDPCCVRLVYGGVVIASSGISLEPDVTKEELERRFDLLCKLAQKAAEVPVLRHQVESLNAELEHLDEQPFWDQQ